MEKGNNKNAVLLTVIGIATLLVAIVGATFAYFSAQVTYSDGSSTLTIVSATGGSSTYSGGEEMRVENIYPREAAWVQKVIRITYRNSATSLNYTYDLDIEYANTFPSGYLTYTFEPITSSHATGVCLSDGSKDSTNCNADLIKSSDNGTLMSSDNGSFSNNSGVAGGVNGTINLGTNNHGVFGPTTGSEEAVHVYLLTIRFLNGSGNQNDAQGKALTARVVYSEVH